jgi:uncharacterized membrane protein YuzA (DUF378 family)
MLNGRNGLDGLCRLLIIVGGLNWGLIGIVKFDLVAWICGGLDFGQTNAASRVIYILVGLAAAYELVLLPRMVGVRDSPRRQHEHVTT